MPRYKKLAIYIDPNLHLRLKVRAAREHFTLSELSERLLLEVLNDDPDAVSASPSDMDRTG